MESLAIALGMSSIMICLGMAIRSKVKAFKNLLIPVNVIAGILGLIYMNVINPNLFPDVGVSMYSDIVDVLFCFSFISIGLASPAKKKDKNTGKEKKGSGMAKGATGMGLIWCILYALTAMVGVGIVAAIGGVFEMEAMYGILIPFAFCQGPGQASTYGKMFEELYGYQNAEMVALTFAVLGFIIAFGIGVPAAKWGMKKNLTRTTAKVSSAVERGYFVPEEQRESMGKVTTHSGNIDTLTIHVALMGITYVIALILAKIISFIPGLGESFAAILFMWGLTASYIVKWAMRKLKIPYILNETLQNKITGWSSDYLVVCAFMGIEVAVIGKWIVPILVAAVVAGFVTMIVCIYFGARLGSDHDFERILGMYGTCTGTTPSGVALVRMIDPRLQTTTAAELAMMNLFMIFSTPSVLLITIVGLGTISLPVAVAGLGASILLYLILLKVFRCWKKPSFNFKTGERYNVEEDESMGEAGSFLQGMLSREVYDESGLVK
ncbi:MAG: sodium/glutamate symporter [Eubacteriales bacterium]